MTVSQVVDETIAGTGQPPPLLNEASMHAQEDMKLALMLNVIDKTIGGVYIVGDRGTGKSVAVRAMADLLPQIQVVAEDPFNSHPTDTSLMGPEALQAHDAGQPMPTATVSTPLVSMTAAVLCEGHDMPHASAEP